MLTDKKRYGFSLFEMAIVFGIIGLVLGGVWTYGNIASQTAKVEQSVESLNITLENTRNVYAGQSIITGGVPIVVPYLVTSGAMPTGLINPNVTACPGVAATQYASNAWGSSGDVCGSFRLCAWVIGTTTNCASVAAGVTAQYIGVEFADLTYSACVALATRVTPTSPAVGLTDVYINGASMAAIQTNALPATVGNAQTACNAISPAIIDFVYTLRAPPS